MKQIFISYRRTDSSETNRIVNFLKREIGTDKIFLDKDIASGSVWPDSIKQALMDSDLMLLVIGPNWLFLQDEMSGKRRIDSDSDWVRIEITTFLKRMAINEKLALIPVLVNGAKIPNRDFLDENLSRICDFQEFKLGNIGVSADFNNLRALLQKYKFSVNPPPVVTPRKRSPPPELSEEEERKFLNDYPDWKIVQEERTDTSGDFIKELYRLYEFENYEEAWKFMVKIDELVIRHSNHHPRWQNTWNRVEFWLCTFNIEYKLSHRDIDIAKLIDEIWKEFEGN